jgi:hypothetical protein
MRPSEVGNISATPRVIERVPAPEQPYSIVLRKHQMRPTVRSGSVLAAALCLLVLQASAAVVGKLDVNAGRVVEQVWGAIGVQTARWGATANSVQDRPPCKSACSQLTHLATFTDDPNPAVTRIMFTPKDMEART